VRKWGDGDSRGTRIREKRNVAESRGEKDRVKNLEAEGWASGLAMGWVSSVESSENCWGV
jgi:hypothetical protein